MRSVARLLFVAMLAMCAAATVTLRGHRLIQYDAVAFGKTGADAVVPLGSPNAKLRGVVRRSRPTEATTQTTVINAAELPEDPTALLTFVQGGLVVLLPPALDADTAAKLAALERVGATTRTAGAVYVVPYHAANVTAFTTLEASTSVAIHASAEAPSSRNGAGTKAAPLGKPTSVSVLALDLVSAPKSQQIAVVAGFDTLGAFPSAPQGAASLASVVAALELAQLFSTGSIDAANGRGITVILSSGDRHSYHGLKLWLSSAADGGAAASLRFDAVVCLEQLVAADASDLTLHLSRDPSKDGASKALKEAFSPVPTVVKRVDPAQTELRWPHEVFAHKGITAATLSAKSAPTPQLLRTSIAQIDTAVKAEDIAKAVNVAAKALQKLTQIAPASEANVERIAKLLAQVIALGNPRPTYKMPSGVVSGLQQLLGATASRGAGKKAPKVRKAEFNFAPPEAVFYGPDEALLLVYPAVPLAQELAITATIFALLIGAGVALLGPSGFVSLIKSSIGKKKKQ